MKTIVIAEAGVNHNGSIKLAKELIDVAKDAGADFVKFQTFKAETLVTKTADKAEYQKKLTGKGETHFSMIKKLELSEEDHVHLLDYSLKKGIKFLSTGFDIDSIDLLMKLNIPIIKIPSGEITNLPLLRHIGNKRKPVILSTGMSTIKEIIDATNVLTNNGLKKENLTILHCNTEYPTPMEDVNLRAMLTIKKELNVNVGYSDHTLGIEVPTAAVAMGASIIEKHFTLDQKMRGPDHKASLNPSQLKEMIRNIRNIEKALGDYKKTPSKSELKNISIARKSIVAKTKIKKGEIFSENNITTKRPGIGISPMEWDKIIGSPSQKFFDVDDQIV
tara:strand:+ start:198 stop:1196 length:999 start_codon:yes stop_codon:yes gene_type:complete